MISRRPEKSQNIFKLTLFTGLERKFKVLSSPEPFPNSQNFLGRFTAVTPTDFASYPMGLTDTKLRNLKPTERPQRFFDGDGLYIELRPNGGK